MISVITFENEQNQEWDCSYFFDTPEEAKEYLKEQGYEQEEDRFFYNRDNGWCEYIKAIIEQKRPWSIWKR